MISVYINTLWSVYTLIHYDPCIHWFIMINVYIDTLLTLENIFYSVIYLVLSPLNAFTYRLISCSLRADSTVLFNLNLYPIKIETNLPSISLLIVWQLFEIIFVNNYLFCYEITFGFFNMNRYVHVYSKFSLFLKLRNFIDFISLYVHKCLEIATSTQTSSALKFVCVVERVHFDVTSWLLPLQSLLFVPSVTPLLNVLLTTLRMCFDAWIVNWNYLYLGNAIVSHFTWTDVDASRAIISACTL